MRLQELHDILLENVDALKPHLIAQMKQYLESYRGSYASKPRLPMTTPAIAPYAHLGSSRPSDEKVPDYDKMIEWVLQADPQYLKTSRKMVLNRETGAREPLPMNKRKAPFAKQIIKWWLDPEVTDNLVMPEDAATTAEVLQQFNRLKQNPNFTNVKISDFSGRNDLINAVDQYIEKIADKYNKYSEMGLPKIFSHGVFDVYLVAEWIDGGESSRYNELCHAAFEGCNWCVKYKNTFLKSYKPPYFLVTKNGTKHALMHFSSLQLKDCRDRRFSGELADEIKPVVEAFLDTNPAAKTAITDKALEGAMRGGSYRLGDFDAIDLRIEISDQLVTDVLSSNNPISIVGLYSLGYGMPEIHWPEGEDRLLQLYSTDPDAGATNTSPYKALTVYVKKMAERLGQVEGERGTKWYDERTDWPAADAAILDHGIPAQIVGWAKIRSVNVRWPEAEKKLLEWGHARPLLGYMRSAKMSHWPEAEPFIAQDPRTAAIYEKLTGHPPTGVAQNPTTPKELVLWAQNTSRELSDEQEAVILRDLDVAIEYAIRIVGPWDDLETKLLESGSDWQRRRYAEKVLRYDWPEGGIEL